MTSPIAIRRQLTDVGPAGTHRLNMVSLAIMARVLEMEPVLRDTYAIIDTELVDCIVAAAAIIAQRRNVH